MESIVTFNVVSSITDPLTLQSCTHWIKDITIEEIGLLLDRGCKVRFVFEHNNITHKYENGV